MVATTPLPEDFDWSILDNKGYKEDAVREDIIAPVLRSIGYKASGTTRMERSKTLVHPYVKIGSKNTQSILFQTILSITKISHSWW